MLLLRKAASWNYIFIKSSKYFKRRFGRYGNYFKLTNVTTCGENNPCFSTTCCKCFYFLFNYHFNQHWYILWKYNFSFSVSLISLSLWRCFNLSDVMLTRVDVYICWRFNVIREFSTQSLDLYYSSIQTQFLDQEIK